MPACRHICVAVTVASAMLGLLASSFATPLAAQERLPSHYDWQRLDTANFEILYPEGFGETAREVAGYAEQAHRQLAVLFDWKPSARVTIILNDASDTHNGYATIFPKPTIEIDLYPPDTRSTIYSPDYLRQVVVHEYAHVLQLDQTDDFRGAFRRVFGVPFPVGGDPAGLLVALLTMPANVTSPPWFLEGGAQWSETEFGAWGRGRQALTWAMVRAAILADAVPSADKAVLAAPDWPYGTTAYLWGLVVLRDWQRRHTSIRESVPGLLTHHMAGMFPGFFQESTKQLTPLGATDYWQSALRTIDAEQWDIMTRLGQTPVTPTARLTPEHLIAFGPTLSPDGQWVYFAGSPPDSRTRLFRVELATGDVQDLGIRLSGISRLWFDPRNPRRLFFTRLEPVGMAETRIALHVCETDAGNAGGRSVSHFLGSTQFVARGRYTEAAPLPDGSGWLLTEHLTHNGPVPPVFHITAGTPDFSGVGNGDDLPDEAVRASVSAIATTQGRCLAHSPIALPGGDFLAVEAEAGDWRIVRFSRDGTRRVLFRSAREILDVALDLPRARLWFVGGEGGALNLFTLDLAGGTPIRRTNTMTAFLEVAPMRDGSVIAVALDHAGPHLVKISADDLSADLGPTPPIAPEWPWLGGKRHELQTPMDAVREGQEAIVGAGAHGVLDGLTFQYWAPFASLSGLQFFAAGAQIYFGDPLGRAEFAAVAGWNWSIDRPFGTAQFIVRPADPEFIFAGTFIQRGYADRVVNTVGQEFDYFEDVALGSFTLALPVRELDVGWRFSLGIEVDFRDGIDHENNFGSGPFVSVAPFEGVRGAVLAGIAFDGRTRFARSVGPESGAFGGISARYRPPIFDQADHEVSLTAQLGLTISLPWGFHTLTLRTAAGWGSGPRTLQGLFVAGQDAAPFSVRGYDFGTQTGRHALAGSVAYRFPLIEIYDGLLTLVYFRALSVEIFADAAAAFDSFSTLSSKQFLASVGIELQLQMAANGAAGFSLAVGYAYATERPASDRHQVYFSVGLPLG